MFFAFFKVVFFVFVLRHGLSLIFVVFIVETDAYVVNATYVLQTTILIIVLLIVVTSVGGIEIVLAVHVEVQTAIAIAFGLMEIDSLLIILGLELRCILLLIWETHLKVGTSEV